MPALSIWIILLFIYLFNKILIWLFNFSFFYYLNPKILLTWFWLLFVVYTFYFIVLDLDKEDENLRNSIQRNLLKNLDSIIIIILFLSFAFGDYLSRWINDTIFIQFFLLKYQIPFLTVAKVKLIAWAIRIAALIFAIPLIWYLITLVTKLFVPKNFMNWIKFIFSFNQDKLNYEISQERQSTSSSFIKTLFLFVLDWLQKGFSYFRNIKNKEFGLKIEHRVLDENWNIIHVSDDKSFINGDYNKKLDWIWIEQNKLKLNNVFWQNNNVPWQNNINLNNQPKKLDNNFSFSKNINDKNLSKEELDVTIKSITTPLNKGNIGKVQEIERQNRQNSNLQGGEILNVWQEQWLDQIDSEENKKFEKSMQILESVNFPTSLIKNGKIYFENNCIFLNKESLQYKDYIIRYYNSIISDKENKKKLDSLDGVFLFLYYDPIYWLVIIPKVKERWSVTAINKNITDFFDNIFFKMDFFPIELKQYFKDYSSSIERIDNAINYYIVLKHVYDGSLRKKYANQYKPFLLKDLFKEIFGENYQEELRTLQSYKSSDYSKMNSLDRLDLLNNKYSILFWKRKLSLSNDTILLNDNWETANKELVVNEPIYSTKHLLLLGKTGFWKTVLLKNIIYSLLAKNPTNDIDFYMVDPKTELIKEFYNLKQVKYIATDLDKTKNLIRYIYHIMTERQNFTSNWNKDFEDKGVLFKPIVLVIEEYIDLSLDLDNWTKALIKKLLVKGRSSGIYIIAVAQFYRSKIFDSVGSQFTIMSVFNEDAETSKKLTWSETYLSKLSMGELLYSDVRNQMYLRVPYENDYEKYLNDWMLRYKNPGINTWQEQKLKFNIHFFIQIIKLYFDKEYSISRVVAEYYNERISYIASFLKFELVYIYNILTIWLVSITTSDLIIRWLIVKELLKAIDTREQQFNVYEALESIDTKGFLKSMKKEIVETYKQFFENNMDIFPTKGKLFDRNIMKNLMKARDEADEQLIEELERKVDPETKIQAIISTLDKMIQNFVEKNIYSDIKSFINFFKENTHLLVEYLELPESVKNEIKGIQIDYNRTPEQIFNDFISALALIIQRHYKWNWNKLDNTEMKEQLIQEEVMKLDEKYEDRNGINLEWKGEKVSNKELNGDNENLEWNNITNKNKNIKNNNIEEDDDLDNIDIVEEIKNDKNNEHNDELDLNEDENLDIDLENDKNGQEEKNKKIEIKGSRDNKEIEVSIIKEIDLDELL